MSATQDTLLQIPREHFISEDSPVIAFTDVRLIDGTGVAAKEQQTVIIRDGRIIAIGPDGATQIPDDAKTISLKGKSLLPGWVMVNEHLYSSDRSSDHEKYSPYSSARSLILTQQSISYPHLYLAAGVTSARTLGSIDPYSDLNVKKNIDAGLCVGPDFEVSAPYIDGEPGELQMKSLKNADEARRFVRYWADEGFSSFHIYEDVTYAIMAAALDEAKQRGCAVAFHTAFNVTMWQALELGVTHITHGTLEMLWDLIPDSVLLEEGISTDKNIKRKSDRIYTGDLLSPTDTAVAEKVQQSFQTLIDDNISLQSSLCCVFRTALPQEIIEQYSASGVKAYHEYCPYTSQSDFENPSNYSQSLMDMELAFWRAGGLLTVGTEAGQGLIAGYTNLRAIELLVIAGFPPLAAIQIATENGAKALGILEDRGTIEVGKRADFSIINGDPSTTITDIYQIETVFKNGIGYDSKALKDSVKGTVRGPD